MLRPFLSAFNRSHKLFNQPRRHVFTSTEMLYENTLGTSLEEKYQKKKTERMAVIQNNKQYANLEKQEMIAKMSQGIEKEEAIAREKIKKLFNDFTKNEPAQFPSALKALQKERKAIEGLAKTIYGEEYQLVNAKDDYKFISQEMLTSMFTVLDDGYHYFNTDRDVACAQFIDTFKIIKLIVNFNDTQSAALLFRDKKETLLHHKIVAAVSKNSGYSFADFSDAVNSKIALLAYKILVYFGNQQGLVKTFNDFDAYLKRHNYANETSSIFEIFKSTLPQLMNTGDIDLNVWRPFIAHYGARGMSVFTHAEEITKKSKEVGIPLNSINNCLQLYVRVKYKNYDKFPELAQLLIQLNIYDKVSEDDFDDCIAVYKEKKSKDNLPNFSIDGQTCGHPGFVFVKLPMNDPIVFILGHLTNCCLHIGENARQCIEDMVTRENNGAYVLLKKRNKNTVSCPIVDSRINHKDYEVVGGGYAWMSILNLIFDSWENICAQYDKIAFDILKVFSNIVIYDNNLAIQRVTIGIGGGTPDIIKKQEKVRNPEKMLEGYQHADSAVQVLILANPDKAVKALTHVSLFKKDAGDVSEASSQAKKPSPQV
jgi:hypothetical protein